MSHQKGRKKIHHYVNYSYLHRWRDSSNAIHVLDVRTGNAFSSTGRTLAAVSGYNDFSFDPIVVNLLNYAFSRRLVGKNLAGDASGIVLLLVKLAKDANYPHKQHNFFEDFYGVYESNVGATIAQIARADLERPEGSEDWALNLLFFYFLQLFRVPKARNAFPGDFVLETPEGSMTLDHRQRREFIMGHMLINSLCTACDVHERGFSVRLRYAAKPGDLINSDAPAVVRSSKIARLEEFRGWMPLTPRIAMEIGDVGSGYRTLMTERVGRDAFENYNLSMRDNAHAQLYFSSVSQRDEYSRRLVRKD